MPKLKVHGRWDEALYVKYPDGVQRTLWTISPALAPAEPRRAPWRLTVACTQARHPCKYS